MYDINEWHIFFCNVSNLYSINNKYVCLLEDENYVHLRFNFITDASGDPSRMTRPEVNTNGEPVSMISTRSYSMIGEVIYLFT